MANIDTGDRFRSKDPRSAGRIVQVVEVFGDDTYKVVNDENPSNTSTVGRKSTISRETLERGFERVSH